MSDLWPEPLPGVGKMQYIEAIQDADLEPDRGFKVVSFFFSVMLTFKLIAVKCV